jgi:predicted Zn finger-like uncharacterized protein
MSLATRCTACGTVFRVVQDQLKVSEGWVRCGRCGEVFNALEGLFDLERSAPPQPAARAAAPASGSTGTSVSGHAPLDAAPAPLVRPLEPAQGDDGPAAPSGPVSGSPPDSEVDLLIEPTEEYESTPGELFDALIESRPSLFGLDSAGSQPPPSEDKESTGGFADARFHTQFSTVGDTSVGDGESTSAAPEGVLAGPAREEAPPTAAFLRDAERAARWQRPAIRATLALIAMLLVSALAAQVAMHFRNRLVAGFPALAGPVQRLCEAAGCSIGPPLQIDAVRVESSGLTESANGGSYRLSLTLRNRARHVVATPSIDLKLTDGNGQLVARRIIDPREFGAGSTTLAPSTDTTLQASLSAGNVRIAGYAVELFYP